MLEKKLDIQCANQLDLKTGVKKLCFSSGWNDRQVQTAELFTAVSRWWKWACLCCWAVGTLAVAFRMVWSSDVHQAARPAGLTCEPPCSAAGPAVTRAHGVLSWKVAPALGQQALQARAEVGASLSCLLQELHGQIPCLCGSARWWLLCASSSNKPNPI